MAGEKETKKDEVKQITVPTDRQEKSTSTTEKTSTTVEEKSVENKDQKTSDDTKKSSSHSNETNPRGKRNDRKGKRRKNGDEDGFDHRVIEIRRVTRMYKGGRRLNLSVFVVVGDRKGRIGLGLGKAGDVRAALDKAVRKAKNNLVQVPVTGNTIPHEITHKTGAAKIMLKPAAPGTGIVAGSSMRLVIEMAGISDVLAKILGTNNKISNAYATVEALQQLRSSKL